MRWTLTCSWFHSILITLLLTGDLRADLEWRVSVKFILDGDGHRATSGSFNTDEEVYESFSRANARLDGYGRGYRFRVVEIENIHGHPEWFHNPVNGDTLTDLWWQAAFFDRDGYLWSDSSINIYVLGRQGDDGSGIAGDFVLLGQNHEDDDTPFHECCHFLGLLHTHGTPNRICTCGDADCNEEPILANAGPDDGVSDTLRDHNCWDTADEIALANFGMLYSDPRLLPDQRRRVDETLNNLMGYHNNREVLTDGQLDRLTDFSNNERRHITSGRTWFVDVATDCQLSDGSSSCSLPFDPLGPFKVVSDGVRAADQGDTVLIRKGRYPGPLTISKKVFLRASRGSAELGAP